MNDPPSPPHDHGRLTVVPMHDRGGVLDRTQAQPELIGPRFHAIADLARGTVAGYEAVLSIGGDRAVAPNVWSADVHVAEAGRLEARLLGAALAARPRLPRDAFLAVDVSSAALLSEEMAAALRDAGPLDRVVLFVADDSGQADVHDLRGILEAVREAGGTVGVDETASGYASLRQVLAIRPDFVRVGAEFVVEVDRDQAKAAVVETLGALASRIDAWVIAAGIPGQPELAALRRMGVPLGQGPLLGPPQEGMGPLPRPVAEAIRAAAPPEDAEPTVAALVEARPALPWGAELEDIADAFLDDPRHDVVVLVDERNRPHALAERAALLRGEPYERPVMRITTSSPLKAVALRAAARPMLERFHPLVACDHRGVYLGIVRVEQLLEALARD